MAAHGDDLGTKIRDSLPWEQKVGANGKNPHCFRTVDVPHPTVSNLLPSSSVPVDGWVHVLDTQCSATPEATPARAQGLF